MKKDEALDINFLYGIFILVFLCISIIFISFFLVATLKLTIQVSIKILIITGIGIIAHYMWSLLNYFKEILETQKKILQFIRMTFISVEKKRLDPENQESARDILNNVLNDENSYRDIDQRFKSPARKMSNVLLTIVIISCTSFIFWKWEEIIEFLK